MRRESGFTLIEVMMMILVLSALAIASIVNVSGDMDQARYDATLREMKEIRDAMYGGDAELAKRNSFGYVGDVGSIPSAGHGLKALWEKPADVEAWSLVLGDPSSSRVGAGWNGPYLPDHGILGSNYELDAWGHSYDYQPDSDPGYLISYGSDGAPGGSGFAKDIRIHLPMGLVRAKLFVVIQDSGAEWNGTATAVVSGPQGPNGTLQDYTAQTEKEKGKFAFEDPVPLGLRSIRFQFAEGSSPDRSGPYEIKIDRPTTLIVLGTAEKPISLPPP